MRYFKKIFSTFGLSLLVVLTTVSSTLAATWVLENDGKYMTTSGTFNVDSSCGLRKSCHWGYNIQEPSSCSGRDMPGQGCDAYRKKWKQWNFDTAYSYPDEYKYTRSKQYVFIPPRHATTKKARYITLGYVSYDGRLQLYYDYDYVSQYAYYDVWVPYNNTTLYGIWKIYLSDVTSNNEPTNWYNIAWDAAKVEY